MAKYRSKKTFDLVQWNRTGDHPDVVSFVGGFEDRCPRCGLGGNVHGKIYIYMGSRDKHPKLVCPGNFIMTESDGGQEVYTKEEVEKSFERVD